MAFKAELYGQNQSTAPQDDRNVLGSIFRQGVRTMTDLVASAGTGFNSNIAAGIAGVPNTYQTQGGLYVVRNDGPVSVLHPTPDATNPRIDTIIVKVYDSVDGGDTSDQIPQPIVVPGTPTSGANLINLNGLGSLAAYQNYIPISYVLVPNGAGSAASFSYLDRRLKTGGFTSIATSESRTNAAYGTLTTPDQVNQVIVPNGGLLLVGYQALWQESVAAAARAAIFIGASQLKVNTLAQAAASGSTGTTGSDMMLSSFVGGLMSSSYVVGLSDVTTGHAIAAVGGLTGVAALQNELLGTVQPLQDNQTAAHAVLGGMAVIRVAAGTYDVGVQFKASSGSVTAKSRYLYVRTIDVNNCMV